MEKTLGYSFAKFADDLGKHVHPVLAPIASSLAGAELLEWSERWKAAADQDRAAHRKKIAALEAAHLAELAQVTLDCMGRTSNALREFRGNSHLLSLPYSGNVPDVLAGYSGPLMRIRWQDAQPVGEGESPVPAGWVLDDNQSGTWLDWINSRSLAG